MQRHRYTVSEVVHLILGSFFDRLTKEEREKYERIMQDEGLLNNAGRLNDRRSVIARLQQKPEFDTAEAYQKFRAYTRRQRHFSISRRIAVAASFVLPLLISATIYYVVSRDENRKVPVVEQIVPLVAKAYITLDNGEKVDLEKADGRLIEKDGTQIVRDSGVLVYSGGTEESGSELIYNELNVPKGGEYILQLADGTKVWLNSDSKLRFPVRFSDVSRDVYLVGEAYFSVQKNENCPFVVHTSLGTVKVLGTEFNVRDYEDERQVVTTLVKGSVKYQDRGTSSRTVVLIPGCQVAADAVGNELCMKRVDLKEYVGWKDGLYVFNRLALGQIMKTVERNYDVSVFFVNERLKQLRFSGDLQKYGYVEQFLKFIETGGDVKFIIKGRTITVCEK